MRKRLYGDDLLTRAELAKAIKKSKTTIRRWEDQGKLKPIMNERGVRLYRVSDVKSIDASADILTDDSKVLGRLIDGLVQTMSKKPVARQRVLSAVYAPAGPSCPM